MGLIDNKQVYDASRCIDPIFSFVFICPQRGGVRMVHQDFCNVTLDQKLRDRWIKLELPDLSLLNSHIWRRYFPSQQFQIDFSVFAAQARSLMMDVSAYHGRGGRKWSFIWIWHPELPNSCPTKSVLIWRRGQKLTLQVPEWPVGNVSSTR